MSILTRPTTLVHVDDLRPGMQARSQRRRGQWVEIGEVDRVLQGGGARWREVGEAAWDRYVTPGSSVEVVAEDFEF